MNDELDKSQLVNYFEQGCKPKERWGIGTEHERFPFRMDTRERLPYRGQDGKPGIRDVFGVMMEHGWKPVGSGPDILALERDGASLTLEPGGQFELSGGILKTLHQTFQETQRHTDELKSLAHKLGVGMLGLGFDPLWRRDQVHWMPKRRYEIMREYMPKVGSLGLDMMLRTCTVQVNLDYASEADMVRKFALAMRLQFVVAALFANSPFTEGKPNGYLSYRTRVWEDTDADRCGFLPFALEEGFGFERWTDYLLDVPMYFIERGGEYLPGDGSTFRQFMARGMHGHRATLQDWETHGTTVFPDVRLKRFIEMRGADSSTCDFISALPAIWVGLLYDDQALDAATQLCQAWTPADIEQLRRDVPRVALNASIQGQKVRDIALRLLQIAEKGLKNRAKSLGIDDESRYLFPLMEVAYSGRTQAERVLDKFHNEWRGDIQAVYHIYC